MKETLKTATRDHRTTIIAIICVVVFALSMGGAGYLLSRVTSNASNSADQAKAIAKATRKFQILLTENLIEGCRRNGNPLRKAEVADLKEGIEDLEDELTSPQDPRLAELFPGISKEVTERIVRESNQRLRKRIERKEKRIPTTDPINCKAQYSFPKEEAK